LKQLAIILDHEYNLAGLSPSTLKNRDRALYYLLFTAMEGLEIHIGLITQDVSYHEDDNGLIKETFTADFLLDRNGLARHHQASEKMELTNHALSVSSYHFSFTEILQMRNFGKVQRNERTVDTGNEGVHDERSYKSAMIAIWPRKFSLDVICQDGIGQAVACLRSLYGSGYWEDHRKKFRQ